MEEGSGSGEYTKLREGGKRREDVPRERFGIDGIDTT